MVEPTKCENKDPIPASLMRFPEKRLLSFYSGVWLKMSSKFDLYYGFTRLKHINWSNYV